MNLNHPVLKWIFLIASAGIFIYAGAIKVWNPAGFLPDVQSYRAFPYHFAVLAVYFVPALEVVCGVGLLIPQSRKGSWQILMALMFSFIVLITVSWFRGIEISCGCFKPGGGEPSSYAKIYVRDFLILLLLAFSGYQQKLISFIKSKS